MAERKPILSRAVPFLAALLLIGAGCEPAVAPVGDSTPPPVAPTAEPPAMAAVPEKQVLLRTAMNRLWEDHITWTRMYIISVAEGLDDKDEVAARLMKNQEDIGDAIKPYYGNDAGSALTGLLKEHITGAVKILDAAKGKDTEKLEAEIAAWRKNGDDIAAFLNSANPANWPLDAMKQAMQGHLDTTLAEATARLEGKHAQDIKDYDAVKEHIYMMAGVLTDGIIKQFPDKF